VIDVEPLIRRELERLYPLRPAEGSWQELVRRAQPRRRHRRVTVAVAAGVALLVCAAAIAAARGGFERWLRGEPGRPAPARVQEEFAAANGASWIAYPPETHLRELIRATSGGHSYTLYGFRSGDSVCLRLVSDFDRGDVDGCAPVSALVRSSARVLPIVTEAFLGRKVSAAEVSFGVMADAVREVTVQAVDGAHPAFVGGNAYLFVEPNPNTGNDILELNSRSRNGSAGANGVTVTGGARPAPLSQYVVDPWRRRIPPGPRRVQAPIKHPTIRWYFRHEKRGRSIADVKLTWAQRTQLLSMGVDRFARLIKPDPFNDTVVTLSGRLCIGLLRSTVGGGQACGGLFSLGPIALMISGSQGDYATIAGVAADGIRRVEIYTANGTHQRAALRANALLALVAWRDFPIRVVGYDAHGRVAASETPFPSFRLPARATKLRVLERLVAPNGATARVMAGARVNGYRCWRFTFSDGAPPLRGCSIPSHGRYFAIERVEPVAHDLFLIGHADPIVARVEIHFQDGAVAAGAVHAEQFAIAIPQRELRPQQSIAYAVAYDHHDHIPQRQRIYFRTSR
jgi:hypothetical protein